MKQHKCFTEMNDLLRKHNGMLAVAIDFSGKGRELIALSVEKADAKVRKKPPSLFATYCPFCGVKLKLSDDPSA